MALVEVRSLSFAYPHGPPALRDVALCVAEGERVALVGPNGAGKSTLLWHLNGLLPFSAGHPPRARGRAGQGRAGPAEAAVAIDGLPVAPENLADVRQRVGLVFQNPDDQLFCPSVQEDVAFGPENLGLGPAEVAQRVALALAATGLSAHAQRSVLHLSLGEKKRACLAGVLACRPQVLALDEPTAGLDPRGRRELLELLAALSSTLLVATHDLELVWELCPRTVLLDGGRLWADGPTRSLLCDEELLLAHGLELPPSAVRAVLQQVEIAAAKDNT